MRKEKRKKAKPKEIEQETATLWIFKDEKGKYGPQNKTYLCVDCSQTKGELAHLIGVKEILKLFIENGIVSHPQQQTPAYVREQAQRERLLGLV
jgi:hypothetical protein